MCDDPESSARSWPTEPHQVVARSTLAGRQRKLNVVGSRRTGLVGRWLLIRRTPQSRLGRELAWIARRQADHEHAYDRRTEHDEPNTGANPQRAIGLFLLFDLLSHGVRAVPPNEQAQPQPPSLTPK